MREVLGIPVALFGALAYFSAFSFRHIHRFWFKARAHFFLAHRMRDVCDDALAAVCAGIPAACLLPLLFVFSRDHFFPYRNRRREPARRLRIFLFRFIKSESGEESD